MDLVNLMYRYINRFINGVELLEGLKNIDLSKYLKKEVEEINQLMLDVQDRVDNIPYQIDETEKNRIAKIDRMLEAYQKSKSDLSSALEGSNKIEKELLKQKEMKYDSEKLYEGLFYLLTQNSLISKYAKKMNDEELLEFITKYISAPMPPVITQEKFDDLVKVGISNDKREALWRLAFNYNLKKINFSLIEDYFLKKRDGYYLTELIGAVQEDLDIDKIIKKIILTKEKKFINDCINHLKKTGDLTDEDIEKLMIEK